jgi:PAS domain S-box-containing protein
VVSLIKPAEIVQHVSELYGVNTTVRIGERIAGRGECCRTVSEALLPEFDTVDEFEYEGNRFHLSFHRALGWESVYLKVAVLALFIGIVLSWMVQRLRLANQDKNRILFERNQLIRRQVDEQTRNLRRLNAELEQQRFAVDQHCIVSIADVAGNISYVNDKFCEISGYSKAELLGRNHRIVKSEAHPPSFYEEMWHTISHGKVWHGVICNRARDGREYWVNSTIVPFLDHRHLPYQYVSIRTDVTPLKQAKESLARQQSELNTILDNVPAMIWCKDREGHFLRVNHAAAMFFGSTPEAMVGHRMEEFFPPELASHCHEAEAPVIETGEAQLGASEVYRNSDGSEARFKVDRVPYRDEAGTVLGVIVMAVGMAQ